MAREYYCEVMGQLLGPLSPAEIRRMARASELKPTDKIREGNGGKWVEARRVKGLFDEQPSPAQATAPATPVVEAQPAALAAATPDDAVAAWVAAPSATVASSDWHSFNSDDDDQPDTFAVSPPSNGFAGQASTSGQPNADLLAAAIPQRRPASRPTKPAQTASGIYRWFLITTYWTPRLVRFSWAIAVGLALLAMLVVVVAYALGVVFGLGDLFSSEGVGPFARGFLGATVSLLMLLAWIWLALYAYRLWCEFLIVVFDIAETLPDIREELRNRP